MPESGVYFVSPDGNNTNAGTAIANPLRTIQKAVQLAPPGSTIVLRAGTYRESIPSLTKQITFQPYPHEQVWLKGSVIVTGFVQHGSIWRKDNWTYKFIPTADIAAIDLAYPMAQYPDQAFIDGNPLTQVASKAQVGAGTFYVDYTLDQLFIGDNPAGRTVEASAYVFAINMQTGSDYSVVRGLGIQQYAPHFESDQAGMILGNANHLTFENNTFAYSANQGLTIFGTDAVIRGNTFIYNSESGLGGYAADRTVVDNNYIGYNNTEHFNVSYNAGGAKFSTTDSMVWTNNLFEFNIGAGAWCDWASNYTQFLNNTFRYNAKGAIVYEKSGYAIMAGNLIYGNSGAGIKLNGANNNKIYNNTFSRNTSHLHIVDDARRTGDATAPGITEYNVISNNILSNGDGTSASLLYQKDYANQSTGDVMVSQLDYNAYYRTSAAIPSPLIGWEVAGTTVYYNTLATFQAARNRELHGLSIDNQATNPFFVNETGGDYHLLRNSPAKGQGQPLPTDVAAALGVTAGVPVDMGAYPLPAPIVDPTPLPTPTVDTTRPSTPTGIAATVISAAQINLAWTASTDNVGVVGYQVFRNGIEIGTPAIPVYFDTGLQAGTSYAYTVAAYDAAGNTSAFSPSVSVTTPAVNIIVTITAPTAGQTVGGTITLRANVSANVTGVNFYVDGVYVGNGGASGGLVTANWITTTVANGKHTIVAKAFAPGATATNTLSVNVAN
jgi:parallel beta-helix repeat protein